MNEILGASSGVGQKYVFSVHLNRVSNPPMIRRSGWAVGNTAVSVPSYAAG